MSVGAQLGAAQLAAFQLASKVLGVTNVTPTPPTFLSFATPQTVTLVKARTTEANLSEPTTIVVLHGG